MQQKRLKTTDTKLLLRHVGTRCIMAKVVGYWFKKNSFFELSHLFVSCGVVITKNMTYL